ncbi:retrovirus-related pol polyprotein from transposon TNT 1-94 [Tanacetum coccineum]
MTENNGGSWSKSRMELGKYEVVGCRLGKRVRSHFGHQRTIRGKGKRNNDGNDGAGKFLKELRDNTFSGSEHEDAKEHIKKILKTKFLNKYCPPARTAKKMEEINNFQQEPDESLFRTWERFKELLMKCPQHYLTDMQEVILFYNGLDVPNRQILDSKGAIPSKTTADAKIAIQEMAEYSQKWHNGTSSRTKSSETSNGLAAIQA